MTADALHVLGPLRPSGMERMLVSAAPYWPDDFSEHVVVGQGDFHPYEPNLLGSGYRVVKIPTVRSVRGAIALWRTIRAHRPRIVHVHAEAVFAPVVFITRIASSAAVVRTIHSVFPVSGRGSWSRRLQAWLAHRWVRAYVAPSQDVASNEARIGRRCILVINWVAQEYIACEPRRQQGRWAAIVGNASPIKNHELALRAAQAGGTPVAYVGSEDGASGVERELLDVLSKLGLLVHRGPGDPMPWLQGASVFLMPSKHEGMGVALAEAIQVGVPAVVSDVPGLRWAAALPGVIVADSDVESWVDAIAQAQALGRDATRAHPDFSPERGAAEYSDVYRRALMGHRLAGSQA